MTTPTTNDNNTSNNQKEITINLADECPKFKEEYNKCFHKWYQEEFLQGKATENICVQEWNNYKNCMIVSVQEKELQVLLDKDFKKEADEEEWNIRQIQSPGATSNPSKTTTTTTK